MTNRYITALKVSDPVPNLITLSRGGVLRLAAALEEAAARTALSLPAARPTDRDFWPSLRISADCYVLQNHPKVPVEIIRAIQTTDATSAAKRELADRVGKTPIGVKDESGYVVNRDAGMKLGANHPTGWLAFADRIGLDRLLSAMNVFFADLKGPK